MKEYYRKRFSLTENGARDVTKATFASLFVYIINMLPAMLVMMIADELLLGNVKDKMVYILVAAVTLIVMFILLWIEYDGLYNSTYKESANLRMETGDILAKLPLSYFSKHDLSDLSQTIMSDIAGIEHAISHSIPKLGALIIFFPIISVLMIIGNWKLGLAVILPTIFSYLFVYLSKKIQIKANNRHYHSLRENSEMFQETIEMQQEIKSFGLSDETKKKLYKRMEEDEVIHILSELKLVMAVGLSAIFGGLGIAVTSFVGVNLLLKGEISVLYLIGYLLAAMKIKDVVDGNKEATMEVFYLDPKIERIKEMREAKTQEGEDVKLSSFGIECKDVYFSYDENTPVLKGVSFKAEQGKVTALVGGSGSGKTSILRLISRLYDYDKGEILMDGKDLKTISTKSLFEKISVVFQDVTLFNTSVMENIRIGRKDATDEEVMRAAELANCKEFIEKMENGYQTLIGENGAELSGGERQRLSIARAFLKDAPILILDEISASLDVDNEKKIQESLNKLIKDKTVIIISHRLKSIENVDKIVVLNDGRVEAAGTHAEMLEKSTVYKNLTDKIKMAEDFVY
ncbi:MAG: ABC transporter ATP-binding protein [Catonella sp.]|uniref:ABC transporter ATP-binding protein n=1 Tax=Catonella sp. TaxID=2382125 RepID=UPI003F9EFF6E